MSLTDELVGPSRSRLLLLVGAVGLVLLLAAVNVAGLMVARGTTRAREMAIRAGLGASRGRLASQAVIESVLLGVAGGSSGLVLAIWIVHPLVTLLPLELPRFNPVAIDPWVYAFTTALSVLAVAGVALAPALQASRVEAGAVAMDDLRTGSATRPRVRVLDGLIAAEVALALVLLTGAGLVSRSLWRLQQVDPGFARHGTLTMTLPLPAARYSSPEVSLAFYETLRERVSALPGVEAAGSGMFLPLGIYRGFGKHFSIEGQPVPTSRDLVPSVRFSIVSPGFLPALGARITSGRGFTAADTADAQQVAIVNETIARRYFPGESPLGRTIYMGVPESLEPPERQARLAVRRTIVGVVADIRDENLQEPAHPRVFVPSYQYAGDGWVNTQSFVVRTAGDPVALAPAVARIVHELDPAQVVASVRTMDEIVAEAIASSESTAILLGMFAGAALLLGAVGVYGIAAFAVAQRTRELGIRIAIGAAPRDVVRLVVTHVLTLALAGVVAGVAVSLALARAVASQLYEVSATDPSTLAFAAAALLLVALGAAWLPARRATRVDPMILLRLE